jgi:hypothetical protein
VKLETLPDDGLKVVCPKCKAPFFIKPEDQTAKEEPPLQQESFVLETVADFTTRPKPSHPKSGISLLMGWILGVIFSLAGLGMLFQHHLVSALFYFGAALILIPPLAGRLNLSLSGKVKALIVLGCVLGAGFSTSWDIQKATPPPAAQKATSEVKPKPEAPKTPEAKPLVVEKPPPLIADTGVSSAGMGVSYNQVMAYLPSQIKMTKSTPVRGEDRYMGSTADNLAMLEIIGAKENISQTTLIIGLPNDSKTTVIRNTGLYIRFLKNTVPEWPGVTDWGNDALKRFASSSESSAAITHGNKLISLSLLKPTSMLTVTVKGR